MMLVVAVASLLSCLATQAPDLLGLLVAGTLLLGPIMVAQPGKRSWVAAYVVALLPAVAFLYMVADSVRHRMASGAGCSFTLSGVALPHDEKSGVVLASLANGFRGTMEIMIGLNILLFIPEVIVCLTLLLWAATGAVRSPRKVLAWVAVTALTWVVVVGLIVTFS
jgi:hypothetical protein